MSSIFRRSSAVNHLGMTEATNFLRIFDLSIAPALFLR